VLIFQGIIKVKKKRIQILMGGGEQDLLSRILDQNLNMMKADKKTFSQQI